MRRLISDEAVFQSDVVSYFSADAPLFLSRIGGSDTSALLDFLSVERADAAALDAHVHTYLPYVERFNGFYDRGSDKRGSYLRYLDELRACYLSMRMATFVHTHLISTFFPNSIHPNFFTADVPNLPTLNALVEEIVGKPDFIGAYPYLFIERCVHNQYTLFRNFTTILSGKTVLVLCPFGESIEANFKNRNSFFKGGYEYPDFKLKIINTPITYAGMDPANYPHDDWFATADALKELIRGVEFDVALMACGSYAMPLGVFIEQDMKKKAIYVGGVLQLLFGVIGRRYENPFFLDQINREHYIQPIERQRYLDVIPTEDSAAREAFGAYF